MSVEHLPSFRYHPDPVATRSIVPRDEVCVACGRSRGFIYIGPVYAASDLDERLCPWCIADGTASERYDAEFTDVGHGVADDVPNETLVELSRCTPGFVGCQQEHWLYRCGDAAAFVGRAGWHELQQCPDALDMLRGEQDEYGLSARELEEYLAGLDKDGGSAAYLSGACTAGRISRTRTSNEVSASRVADLSARGAGARLAPL